MISTTTLHSLIDSSALFILSFIYSTKFIFHFSYCVFQLCLIVLYMFYPFAKMNPFVLSLLVNLSLSISILSSSFFFIYSQLHWIFIDVHSFSLVAISGSYSLLWAHVSHFSGFSYCGAHVLGLWASAIIECRLSSLSVWL